MEYGHPYNEVLQSVYCLTDSILNPALCITVYFFLQSTNPFPPSDLATILAKPKDFLLFGLLLWQKDQIISINLFSIFKKYRSFVLCLNDHMFSSLWISSLKESLARTSLV